jgi:hypothetical protein
MIAGGRDHRPVPVCREKGLLIMAINAQGTAHFQARNLRFADIHVSQSQEKKQFS